LSSPSGHVLLRPWGSEDADFLLASFADDEVRLMTPLIEPISLDIARRWILEHSAKTARPASPAFLITTQEGLRVGAIGATNINWRSRQAEFFYWVLAPWRNQGFASAALATISSWALEEGLQRLELMIDVQNQASAAVALRAGYRFERVISNYRVLNGRSIDAAAYARLA